MTCNHSLWAFALNYAGTAHHHLACTVCWADTAQQAAGAILQAWPPAPRALRLLYPTSRMWRHVQVAIQPAQISGRSPQTSRYCFDDIQKLLQCLRGHFVHVQLGSHLHPRASTGQGLVLCGQIPRPTRICNTPGEAAHWITFCSRSGALR